MEEYLVPKKISICALNVEQSFNNLTEKEKLYAHNMNMASWSGALIVSKQVSPKSYLLVEYFVKFFKQYTLDDIKKSGSKDDIDSVLNYVCYLFGNMGDYSHYGDKKFIPRLSQDTFKEILLKFDTNSETIDKILKPIYSLNKKLLGYYPDNVTCYTTKNMTKDEAELINK